MPEPLTLQGHRVQLSPLSETHIAALLAAANESRENYTFARVPADRPAMEAYIDSALRDLQTGWALPFTVTDRATQRIIGTTRFLDLDYWSWPPTWPPGRATPRPDDNARPAVAEIGRARRRKGS